MATARSIDTRPIGYKQAAIVLGALAVMVIDGIDIQLLSLVTPVLLAEWSTTRAAFGPALSAALVGMALGTGTGGWLGDRYGRKAMLILATTVFGIATVAASFVDDIAALAALRLLSGLGFGAASPNGAALVSEWLPMRARPKAIALLSISIPAGGTLGASLVLWLLPQFGWRGCFVACGLLTLAVAALLAMLMPESPSYLLRAGRRDKAERLVARIAGAGTALPSAEPAIAAGGEDARLFTRANLRLNAASWTAFFALQLVAYGIIAWSTVFLTMAGWSLPQAISGIAVFNMAAMAAALTTGMLLGRIDARILLLVAYALTIVGLATIAATLALYPGAPTPGVMTVVIAAIGAVGGFGSAGITTLYALFANAYPVRIRGSGIGFGLTSGRVGGIVITAGGGWLLAVSGDSSIPFFAFLVATMVVATVATLSLGRILPDSFRPAPADLP